MSGSDAQTSAQQQSQLAQQRAPVATTAAQLVLQSQQAAAAGHVILQPGQQLISATPGQHVLASVDGRTQQMTIVQGPTSGAVAAASLLVRCLSYAAYYCTCVATSSCRGHIDKLATEPFLLLHREHGTGC